MADEPLFMAIRDSDPAYRQTVRNAQSSLAEFRRLLQSKDAAQWYPCVKTRITAGQESAFIWLSVVRVLPSGFVASVFEIPPEFQGVRVGDRIQVPDEDVMDWMVNRDGELHGGFSLRYQRSLLPPEKHAWYDEHIGVSKYADPIVTVRLPDSPPMQPALAKSVFARFRKWLGHDRGQ